MKVRHIEQTRLLPLNPIKTLFVGADITAAMATRVQLLNFGMV
ncbi:hypothetical protein TOI97_11950 [Denitrificimonas sp. JX-1]|uniref:Uncharacterized protein n=1 Tax=Denitrificimonas halotolerans TaxID=3098930 RepID=A0ABU5GV85_9GAMM|nr:hypothetical protein [Denitrificimonas sp. JX-1]MDY7220275.1 hypothetical protein [Denitrificimonas sp. JX-1]